MSFSGTPLGQGRRLDHSTFLGKPTSSSSNSLPSYAYGAPALGSRSPPKPTSPLRDRSRPHSYEHEEEENDPALIRFARLKQRESAAEFASRPGGPKVIDSPLKPEKWNVKDTSVNIATAFIQAASGDMSSTYNPNNSWASGSRANAPVPRSTSVEFEQSVPAAANRRLAPPPNRFGRGPTARKPVSKSTSLQHVPDSEGEEDANGRGKSPFEHGINMARQALGAAVYYVRQHSQEPENTSGERPPPSNGHDGNESSYSYTQEEASFQAAQKRNLAGHKKARMSVDNKAYRPSQSDEEESDYSEDGEKKRGKKTKKGPVGGPLTTLPVVSGTKKRRGRKGQGSKGNTGGVDEDENDSDGVAETDILSQSAQLQGPAVQTSKPLSRTSATRLSREPPEYVDTSMASANQGLDSIPEIAEDLLNVSIEPPVRQSSQQRRARSRSRTPGHISQPRSASFSIGGLLGSIVRIFIRLGLWMFSCVVSVMSMLTFLFGQVFGTTFDIILRRPAGWARGASSGLKYLVPAVTMLLAWYVLQDTSLRSYIPNLSFPARSAAPTYHAPDVPPADLSDFFDRLQRVESALSALSADTQRTIVKTEDSAKAFSDTLGRISSLEGRISSETRRISDTEARAREAVSRTVSSVLHEVEVLQSQIAVHQKQQESDQKHSVGSTADEDARAKLRVLEERMGSVEGGVREALELGQKAVTAVPPTQPSSGPGSAWWNKLAAGSGSKSVIQIKSTDGQDVSGLITQLVDSAVSRISKDGIAKPDFAMSSSGARVIPSLTSPAFELRPRGLTSQITGLFTGKGYFDFRPPIWALNHEVHAGYCWPFAGTQGQLGVMLVAPIILDEVTIDHVAKEVAFDMRSAPKRMEVWGFVEGADNTARIDAWKTERALRKEAGEQGLEDEVPYPSTLPKNYIRVASFTYDIDAPNNVQTFPVDPEIRSLSVDFGIVVLRVLDNWGRNEFTCLYRFRVHGTPMGEIPLPFSLDGSEQS